MYSADLAHWGSTLLQAIVDVTKDQMNITKYANNPEIMAVFNKMSTLFAPKP